MQTVSINGKDLIQKSIVAAIDLPAKAAVKTCVDSTADAHSPTPKDLVSQEAPTINQQHLLAPKPDQPKSSSNEPAGANKKEADVAEESSIVTADYIQQSTTCIGYYVWYLSAFQAK